MKPDSFNSLRFPHMARGDFMFNGYAVVVDPRILPEHIGDEIKPLMPHPMIQWFLRKLRRPVLTVMFVRAKPIEQHNAFESQGKLFMSPVMWKTLQEKIPCRT